MQQREGQSLGAPSRAKYNYPIILTLPCGGLKLEIPTLFDYGWPVCFSIGHGNNK
jgi:hypothetical protein